MTKPSNQPAFPGVAHFTGATHSEGMSLRDWFAGQALAMCQPDTPRHIAEFAYVVADAMLAQRERGQ